MSDYWSFIYKKNLNMTKRCSNEDFMSLWCKETMEIIKHQKLCTLHLYWVGIQLVDENYNLFPVPSLNGFQVEFSHTKKPQRFVYSIRNIEKAIWIFNCLGRPGRFGQYILKISSITKLSYFWRRVFMFSRAKKYKIRVSTHCS